jgi:hypothetical protein
MLTVSCNQCSHEFEVDDSLAGKSCLCMSCGHEMTVPSGGFRLQPIPEAERAEMNPAPIEPFELAGEEPAPAVLESMGHLELGIADELSDPGDIPEAFLADRAPCAPDQEEGPIELDGEGAGSAGRQECEKPAPDEIRRERT